MYLNDVRYIFIVVGMNISFQVGVSAKRFLNGV